MKKEAEFIGKKVQDAVSEGLKTLNLTLDDVEVKIISNGGLFKKAKVVLTYDDGLTEEQAAAAKAEAEAKIKAEAEAKAKEKAAREVKSHEAKARAPKEENPPEGEPHWGSAPVKREPSMARNFGKAGNAGAEKPAKENVAPKSEKPAGEKPHKKEREGRESVLPTEEQIALAKQFVTELISKMGISGEVTAVVDEGLRVNIDTEDSRIIGHRGEVLDSVQNLISALINTSHGSFVHVTVDGLGYRDRRKESLEHLANRMAEKAVRTHRKVALEVMNSADRRVIHAALGDREDVFTRSEGHDPARRVVIVPKRK